MAMVNQLLGGTIVISQRAAWSVRGEKSRMKREFHVRFCEGAGVQFPCATRLLPDPGFALGPHGEGEEPKPMMDGREKSDPAIVAVKPTNKAGQPVAELVEPRAGTEGKAGQQSTCRAQNRESVSQALDRIRQAARQRKKEQFTALFHHISLDLLRVAFLDLKRNAAPGVDGLTWQDYEADLDRNLTDLHDRVHRGAYRALPSRRRYIPKADGRQRPLAIATLEDKIVQGAVAEVLAAVY